MTECSWNNLNFSISLVEKMSSNSVEIYLKAIEFLGKRGGLLGMNIIQPEYKLINFKSLLVILDTITYTLVTIYCMFEFAGDLERMVFCLVTYGFGIQVSFKSQMNLNINLSCIIPGKF